ncbi:hypothetical protein [Deinococcus pimensis]|uniref:hypothetical protein n=1 Tax=Deinococcus pimensis TaxID=309888 RepID=UPI0004882F7F|nr:hypothetical protein [Deinococcus pimensis]
MRPFSPLLKPLVTLALGAGAAFAQTTPATGPDAADLVTRAFRQALQRAPTSAELAYWAPLTRTQRLSVETLTLAQAAWGASLTYQQVLGRAPASTETRAYADAALRGESTIDRLWSQLVTGDEYRRANGRNGPAAITAVTYRNDARLDPAATPAAPRRCFGSLSRDCATPDVLWKDRFTRADGVVMAYAVVRVSVGSILLDNACRNVSPGAPACASEGEDAAPERRRADADAAANRTWQETYGPYPLDPHLRAAYTDDLTPAPARATLVSAVPAPVPFGWDETRETRRLAAPPGQTLDVADARFCRTGRFRDLVQLPTPWGTCE